MEAVLILPAFAGVCLLLVKLIDMWGESTMGEEGWADAQKAAREADEMKKEKEEKKKYNDYMFTCPMCGSKKVRRIGTANRAASIAVTGLASGKIGKQYECDNCRHKW